MPYLPELELQKIIAAADPYAVADDDYISEDTGEVWVEAGHRWGDSPQHPRFDEVQARARAEARAKEGLDDPATPPADLAKLLDKYVYRDDDAVDKLLSNPAIPWDAVQNILGGGGMPSGAEGGRYVRAIVQNIGYAMHRWAGGDPLHLESPDAPAWCPVADLEPNQHVYVAEMIVGADDTTAPDLRDAVVHLRAAGPVDTYAHVLDGWVDLGFENGDKLAHDFDNVMYIAGGLPDGAKRYMAHRLRARAAGTPMASHTRDIVRRAALQLDGDFDA